MVDKKEIVVVDDNQEFLEALQEMLQNHGYSVVPFLDADSALDRIGLHKPDLIITDLKMKGKSGFQLGVEITKVSQIKDVPVIAMTGYYTKKEHEFLIKFCGIKKCLTKPFKPWELLRSIERQLSLKKKKRRKP